METLILSKEQKEKARKKAWYKANSRKANIASRKWVLANKDKVKVSRKNWNKKNHERIVLLDKKWRKDHPEEIKEIYKNSRIKRAEKIKAYSKEWYAKNADKSIAYSKKYKKLNPESNKVHQNKVRAKRKLCIGKFTVQEWQGKKKEFNYTCPRCGKSEPEISLTVDHIKPLSLGGSNNIENIQPLCLSCNSRKNAKYIKYYPLNNKNI